MLLRLLNARTNAGPEVLHSKRVLAKTAALKAAGAALSIQLLDPYSLAILGPAQHKSGNVVASGLPAKGLQIKQFANHRMLVLHQILPVDLDQPVYRPPLVRFAAGPAIGRIGPAWQGILQYEDPGHPKKRGSVVSRLRD